MGGVAAAASLVLPATVSSAAVSRPQPSLASLVAQAKSLGHQIDVLSEQYDGLRIQMAEARAEAKTMTTYRQVPPGSCRDRPRSASWRQAT